MDSYSIGMIIGFLAALLIVFLIATRDRKKKQSTRYDERQESIRGYGYKYAYLTFGLLSILYIILSAGTEINISPQLVMTTVLLISGLVLAGYTIFHDSYWGTKQKKSVVSIICWIILFIAFLLQSIDKILHGQVVSNGYVTFVGGLPIVIAGFFIVFFIMLIAKQFIDSKCRE